MTSQKLLKGKRKLFLLFLILLTIYPIFRFHRGIETIISLNLHDPTSGAGDYGYCLNPVLFLDSYNDCYLGTKTANHGKYKVVLKLTKTNDNSIVGIKGLNRLGTFPVKLAKKNKHYLNIYSEESPTEVSSGMGDFTPDGDFYSFGERPDNLIGFLKLPEYEKPIKLKSFKDTIDWFMSRGRHSYKKGAHLLQRTAQRFRFVRSNSRLLILAPKGINKIHNRTIQKIAKLPLVQIIPLNSTDLKEINGKSFGVGDYISVFTQPTILVYARGKEYPFKGTIQIW